MKKQWFTASAHLALSDRYAVVQVIRWSKGICIIEDTIFFKLMGSDAVDEMANPGPIHHHHVIQTVVESY